MQVSAKRKQIEIETLCEKAKRSKNQKQNALPITDVDETEVSKINKLISLPKHSGTIS